MRDRLPAVAVVEVTGLDEDGELLARPAVWELEEAPPARRKRDDKSLPMPRIREG